MMEKEKDLLQNSIKILNEKRKKYTLFKSTYHVPKTFKRLK